MKVRRWKYELKGSYCHHHVNKYDFIIYRVNRNLAFTVIQKILIDSEKMRSYILMKSFSIIHVLVSDSSNAIFLKIWIIANFIRTHVQDHLQFSIVSSLLFKILQLYSCQYLSIFQKYLYLKVNSPIVCSVLWDLNFAVLYSSLPEFALIVCDSASEYLKSVPE